MAGTASFYFFIFLTFISFFALSTLAQSGIAAPMAHDLAVQLSNGWSTATEAICQTTRISPRSPVRNDGLVICYNIAALDGSGSTFVGDIRVYVSDQTLDGSQISVGLGHAITISSTLDGSDLLLAPHTLSTLLINIVLPKFVPGLTVPQASLVQIQFIATANASIEASRINDLPTVKILQRELDVGILAFLTGVYAQDGPKITSGRVIDGSPNDTANVHNRIEPDTNPITPVIKAASLSSSSNSSNSSSSETTTPSTPSEPISSTALPTTSLTTEAFVVPGRVLGGPDGSVPLTGMYLYIAWLIVFCGVYLAGTIGRISQRNAYRNQIASEKV